MAVYKVIQDVESEDKIVGPFSLKSFIYAAIAALLIFIQVRTLLAGTLALSIRLIIFIILLPPAILFGTLASPLGKDQPTEVWLLSHIRFLIKPRARVWRQGDSIDLVTVTAPKKAEVQRTKDLDQLEVESRLQALASTLDSRGWAVKNASVNLTSQPGYLDESEEGNSDRLVGTSSVEQQAPAADVHAADDIMDEKSNATAQNFTKLVKEADDKRKEEMLAKLKKAREEAAVAAQKAKESEEKELQATKFNKLSMPKVGMPKIDIPKIDIPKIDLPKIDIKKHGQSKDKSLPNEAVPVVPTATFVKSKVIAPGPADENRSNVIREPEDIHPTEDSLLKKWHERDDEIHQRSSGFQSTGTRIAAEREKYQQAVLARQQYIEAQQRQAAVTAAQTAAKLELAQSGNDLSVASIAKLANRNGSVEEVEPNEVVLSLH